MCGRGLSRDRSCARRERGGRSGFRAVREGASGCGRSYARFGPVPRRLGAVSGRTGTRGGECAGGGFRGIGPALAGNVEAGRAFALCARGRQDVDVPMLASARSCGGWVRPAVEQGLGVVSLRAAAFAGSVLRSQGTWGQVGLSRCARGGVRMWTFLCSLRPGPAVAGCGQRSNRDSGW